MYPIHSGTNSVEVSNYCLSYHGRSYIRIHAFAEYYFDGKDEAAAFAPMMVSPI